MHFYNPQKPGWSGKIDQWHEFDAQINAHEAFCFNAASFDEAMAIAERYGAYELTQFTRPCRVVRSQLLQATAA